MAKPKDKTREVPNKVRTEKIKQLHSHLTTKTRGISNARIEHRFEK